MDKTRAVTLSLRTIKVVVIIFSIAFIIKLAMVFVNVPSAELFLSDEYRDELLARRSYLIAELEKGHYDIDQMPNVGVQFQYEWGLVSSSMSAMALTNLAFRFPETRLESVRELEYLVELVLDEEYRGIGELTWGVDPLQNMEHSPAQIGYSAHLGLIIGAYKYCGGSDMYDSIYTEIHQSIIRTIGESATPYLETYPNEVYTADNAAMYASLKLYDQLMGEDNSELITQWIDYTKAYVTDQSTGIMKSYVTDISSPRTNSRGSWAGWCSFYLPLIDSVYARDQYEKVQKQFVDKVAGFTLCREYPKGVRASGDIDSGPVIFGGSSSGTAFILGGAVHHNDSATIEGILFTAEFVGTTISSKGGKHYLLSPLVGDAVMLAMMTAQSWDDRYLQKEE